MAGLVVKKIALLFLVYDDIYHYHFWDKYIGDDRFTLYVHSKVGVPAESPFKPYEMAESIPTKWESTMHA